MTTIARILTPVDSSDQESRVLAATAELARLSGATVRVLHVHADSAAFDTDNDTETPGAANGVLSGALAILRGGGVNADGYIAHSAEADVDDLILLSARDYGADLIVLGANHRTGLRALLEPSVADQVARQADVMVLLVP
jgi:nucleotide-binding universal stress UspA family protein